MKEVKRPKCPLPLDNQKNTRRNAARRTAWKRYYDSMPLPKVAREEGVITRELQNRQADFVQIKLGQMTYRERYWFAAIKAMLSKTVSDYWVIMNYEFCVNLATEMETKAYANWKQALKDTNYPFLKNKV